MGNLILHPPAAHPQITRYRRCPRNSRCFLRLMLQLCPLAAKSGSNFKTEQLYWRLLELKGLLSSCIKRCMEKEDELFSPQKYIFHEPTFLLHISRKGKWGPFNTDE